MYELLNNINENKPPLYQVLNKIHRNKIIPLVQKLAQLENDLFHHILFFFKFINFKGMGNIRFMVLLLMSL
jgi:hypothetical protein